MNDSNQVNKEDLFKSKDYSNNINQIRDDIRKKISGTNNRLAILGTQLQFIEKQITSKQHNIERIPDDNHTARRKLENSVLYNLDLSSRVHENIIKYENLIKDYNKYLIDIENNKLNAYTKIAGLNKDEKGTDKDYQKLMKDIHDQMNNQTIDGSGSADISSSSNPIAMAAMNELQVGGYFGNNDNNGGPIS